MSTKNNNQCSLAEFDYQLLKFLSEQELCGMLWWRCDGEYAPITWWINTNDLFSWGCADGEQVTPDNFQLLVQAVADCVEVNDCCGVYGCELFACRVNKMRPQGAAYTNERALWPLFDACGPEREVGFGNPYRPGEYGRSKEELVLK